MSSSNQIEAVDLTEVVCDFRSKDPAGSSSIDGPIFNIFGIWPHQVTERSFMRDLYFSINGSNLIDRFDFRTETSVDAEDFVVDDCSKRKIVKNFSAILPGIGVSILLVDLIIETVDSSDLSGFVVPSQESDSVRMLDFEA